MEAPPGSKAMRFPFTLGHENAGWVEKLGPGAAGYSVGDPVLVYGPWGCGHCANCRVGMENYCENIADARPGGLGSDGGMANTCWSHPRAFSFLSALSIQVRPLR